MPTSNSTIFSAQSRTFLGSCFPTIACGYMACTLYYFSLLEREWCVLRRGHFWQFQSRANNILNTNSSPKTLTPCLVHVCNLYFLKTISRHSSMSSPVPLPSVWAEVVLSRQKIVHKMLKTFSFRIFCNFETRLVSTRRIYE